MSIYRCAQLVRQADSLELNLLPGVLVMHLSQHALVSFATVSLSIAFSFSCCPPMEIIQK
uniref:Mitochondrial import inner membrane translocase subunit Tim8/small zinc finger-like protein n=1 Tax=Rhizophora mucronata TaxID=61149 RepID=A0A2P2K386_RHIMU